MSGKKRLNLSSWPVRGGLAFGGWLILLWVAGLQLPEDGSFPGWYTALMLPIYPPAALSAFLLPEDTAGFWLPALMLALCTLFGAGVGWVIGLLAARKHRKRAAHAGSHGHSHSHSR